MADIQAVVAEAHRRDWARVLSTVVRLTRDIDLAEDSVQEAFISALEVWQRNGVPDNPAAWLTTVARRKALDRLRRDQTLARKLPLLVVPDSDEGGIEVPEQISDDRLRLVFTCCHPALALESQIPLTLRLVCGLATPEIARLLLIPEPTVAARITRAKKKIRSAGIPYQVPGEAELPERLPAVLAVVYLVFTEGHTASRGDELLQRRQLAQATELARVLAELMPDQPEVIGLLALIRLTDARRASRLDAAGRPVLLEDQDRSLWDRQAIAEGTGLVERALQTARRNGERPGPYALQAAIAALHAEAPRYEDTDWAQILALYDALLAVYPSPVAALSRTVAYAKINGPEAGLAEVERLAADPRLAGYHLLPAARADLLSQLGRNSEASAAYAAAAEMTANAVEQGFLRARAAEAAGR
jgi:RNA polymerase sigma-70 factor (ECF subfamily)